MRLNVSLANFQTELWLKTFIYLTQYEMKDLALYTKI
jgi:hypothetical protein